MNNSKIILYLFIFAIGLTVSALMAKSSFSAQTLGMLIFFLIFIPTLLSPEIGLIIIIFSMLFSPEAIMGRTGARMISVRAEDIILIVIILAWLIKVALTKNIPETFKTNLSLPYFSYVGSCFLSTALAMIFSTINLQDSLFAILKYLEYFLLFIMVKDSLKSLKLSKIYIAVFLLTAIMVAAHSNIFIAQEIKSGATYFRVAPPVETRGGGEAGTLGGYLIFMIAVTGGLLLYSRSPILTIFLILLELFMFRAMLYTLSRGSYVAVVPMIIALIYFTKSKKLILIYLVVAASLMSVFFMPQMVRERIFTTVRHENEPTGTRLVWEESPRARLDSFKVVLFEKFPRSPIFGYGTAKFFIDSQPFMTLCEAGLLGLLLLVWVLMRLFKAAKKVLTFDVVRDSDFAMGLTVGFMAGFVGLCFNAISTNTFIIIKIMEPFWFIAAIVLSLPQLLRKEEEAIL